MVSCELIKCPWYVNGKCSEPNDYVNRYTGEEMCSRNSDAVTREEFMIIKNLKGRKSHE